MVNLLLLLLMIFALLGMVFCNRQQRKSAKFQLLALSLLVVIIASGGLFMCRMGTPSALGWHESENQAGKNENLLQAAQGFVVAGFIRNNSRPEDTVLVVMPENLISNASSFCKQLFTANIGKIQIETIKSVPSDKLITPAVNNRAETQAIDAAIARHPLAKTIILYGLAPSGNSIRYLQIYEQPYDKRAKIIVLGLGNLDGWAARQLREGFFEALITVDLTKVPNEMGASPENLMEVFDSCYVLITRENMERNRRFFR